jgi:hypothetical protein
MNYIKMFKDVGIIDNDDKTRVNCGFRSSGGSD